MVSSIERFHCTNGCLGLIGQLCCLLTLSHKTPSPRVSDTQFAGTSLKVDEKQGFHLPTSWYRRTMYPTCFSQPRSPHFILLDGVCNHHQCAQNTHACTPSTHPHPRTVRHSTTMTLQQLSAIPLNISHSKISPLVFPQHNCIPLYFPCKPTNRFPFLSLFHSTVPPIYQYQFHSPTDRMAESFSSVRETENTTGYHLRN